MVYAPAACGGEKVIVFLIATYTIFLFVLPAAAFIVPRLNGTVLQSSSGAKTHSNYLRNSPQTNTSYKSNAVASTMFSTNGESSSYRKGDAQMSFPVNLSGKTAFVAGVADSSGYGWAIAKHLAAAGARIVLGTWPPVYGIFKKSLESGKFDKDMNLPNGGNMKIDHIFPLDAVYDAPEDVPEDVKSNKRYAGVGEYTVSEVAEAVKNKCGNIDILVHSLANGPEVTKPLLETTRKGYLAAVSASSYSLVSMLQRFGPLMNRGGSTISLTYIASEKVIPGYGGGMSSAKAALESDTRTLAWEAGRKYGIKVNTISAGPLKSRAASAIGKDGDKTFIEYAIDYSRANSPLDQHLDSDDVGSSALFLLSPMSRAVTGVTLYVDNGLHAMGQSVDSASLAR